MNKLFSLIKRNVKLFFKDKGMFFTAMVTPIILLFLYAVFLGDVFRNSFVAGLPEGFVLSEDILDALVGGQLVSSILSVSCVTVAFCSNFLMVQDKANGVLKDLKISPVKRSTLAVSYYAATLISTLLICFTATIISLVYVSFIGWYMTFADIVLLFLDVLVLSLFGTALSSIINYFLSSQGQISAVSSIVTAGYGFICGAYMPISSFATGLQKVLLFLPGTYGTSLIRNHSLGGVFAEMESQGIPTAVVDSLKASLDCSPKFFDWSVSIPMMYVILGVTILVLLGAYILINSLKKKHKRGKRNG
ncbi:MAG: ABC transporter permease [Clostridiales bacterium]|nr:ABC transporter permease [Clostridiales bacterium]